MALKQTRRTVSLNRAAYDALSEAAKERDVSQSKLVIDALRAYGIDMPAGTRHQDPSRIRYAQLMRGRSASKVIARIDAVKARSDARREGPIRQALGDEIADMCGEP